MKRLFLLMMFPFVMFFIGIGCVKATNYVIVIQNVDTYLSERVNGSEFELHDKDGNLVERWTVNGDKKITVTSPGKYYLKEESAAPRYQLLKDPIEIVVGDNAEELVKVIHNPTKVTINSPTGIVYDLYDEDGKKIWTWKQVDPTMVLERLHNGNYTIRIAEVTKEFSEDEKLREILYKTYKNATREFVVDRYHEKQMLYFDYILLAEPPYGSDGENKIPSDSKNEEIKNVPNTSVNEHGLLYGIGTIIILFGSGVVYKHIKQN